MGRSIFPIALVLIAVAALGAIMLPELFGLITGIQAETTGVSASTSELVGRLPLILFVIIGVTFTAVLTMAARK